MKITALFVLLGCLHLSATSLSQTITLKAKEQSFVRIFEAIQQQTDFKVVYSDRFIQSKEPVTVSAEGMPLEDFLTGILSPQNLTYEIVEKTILIKKVPAKKQVQTIAAVPAAQQRTITGRVVDEQGQALTGVNVRIKGKNTVTVTKAEGKYTVRGAGDNTILVFSYLGFTPVERKVGDQSVINVVLREQKDELNEVVVIGYGEVNRKDLTGSVAQVRMGDFEKAPVKSFDDALAGRIAGVQVSGNDGQPGQNNNIVIRGAGSITQDNSPLYVIDGFPMEDANSNSVNPDDIESIDVLKDASATAIYGARGANGVIMITTKKGKIGDPVITYNGYYGLQKNLTIMDLMDGYEFVKYQSELDPTRAERTYFVDGKDLDWYKTAPSFDFQDYIYRVAPMQNHNISMRGGTEKTRYSISGNVLQQDGVIINSGFKRYQGRFTFDQTVNKKLKTGINVNYSSSNTSGSVPTDVSHSLSYNMMYAVWGYRPVTATGEDLLSEYTDPGVDQDELSDYRVNPVLSAENEYRTRIANTIVANIYAEYKIVPSLQLRVTGGYTGVTRREDSFFNSLTSRGNPRGTNGVNGSIYFAPANTFLNENTLTWTKKINKIHSITALAGASLQVSRTGRYGFSALKVPNEELGVDGLDESSSQIGVSGASSWGLVSFLGRVQYSYKSKYLFTGSLRSDGSSKFSSNNTWSYFPSGSVAWRMSDENFIKKLKFIDDAKLRLSYGHTGNNRISDFSYLSEITFPISGGYSYNNGTPGQGANLNAFGNPALKWETTVQTDIGYDLSLFKRRLELTVDVYRKTTRDLLLNAQLPYSTGMNYAFKNVGKMRNQGLEVTVNTVNVQTKNFQWSSSFNISFNNNKVLALAENQSFLASPVSIDQRYNALAPYIAVLSQPVAQMYGLIWDGVFQYSDFDRNSNGTYTLKPTLAGNGNPNVQPGDIKYADINGDGEINSLDFTVIGRALPIHTGGFSNNFVYKAFDLNLFFQWSYGNDLINANRLIFEGNGKQSRELNQFASYVNRWTPDNPSNTLYRAKGEGPAFYSSRIVEDGSYLRLKTVSLGYTFSPNLLRRAKIRSLRVYTSAQNLLTWTGYSGPDPEVSVKNSTLTPGFDFSAYPRARTLTLGLNVSF